MVAFVANRRILRHCWDEWQGNHGHIRCGREDESIAMAGPTATALRYAWSWSRRRTAKRESITFPTRRGPASATLLSPNRNNGPHPGWVVLHGVTKPGPEHPSLVRFVNALACAGQAVVVPDIPHWRELDLSPAPAREIIDGAIAVTETIPQIQRGGVGLIGFSFGCPQVLIAASDSANRGRVTKVVGFGGYCDLESTVSFGLTGRFSVGGEAQYLRPDPYGRWVVGSNYLHRIPGLEDASDVAASLRRLAILASERRIMSWDPAYDSAKDEMAAKIPSSRRHLFRLFAPPAAEEPDPALADELAPQVALAARSTHPSLDPFSTADAPPAWIRLLHGKGDHLIPYTETLALERRLSGLSDVHATITDLFAHSEERRRGVDAVATSRFLWALRDVFSGVPAAGL